MVGNELLQALERRGLDELGLDRGVLRREAAEDLGPDLTRAVRGEADPEQAVLAADGGGDLGRRAVGALDDLSSTLRVVRLKSSPPSCVSSTRICAESAGWAMCSRSAARLKFSSSATARK